MVRITAYERLIAVKVVSQSRGARQWALGEARFLNIDIDSLDGKQFLKEKAEAYAKRIIRR